MIAIVLNRAHTLEVSIITAIIYAQINLPQNTYLLADIEREIGFFTFLIRMT